MLNFRASKPRVKGGARTPGAPPPGSAPGNDKHWQPIEVGEEYFEMIACEIQKKKMSKLEGRVFPVTQCINL